MINLTKTLSVLVYRGSQLTLATT